MLAVNIPFLAGATITQQERNTLSAIIDRDGPVKVSFFGLPSIVRTRHPQHIAPDNGLQVASLLDLAGTKAAVVQQRAEAKDYFDIDSLLQDGALVCRPHWSVTEAFKGRSSIRRSRSRRCRSSAMATAGHRPCTSSKRSGPGAEAMKPIPLNAELEPVVRRVVLVRTSRRSVG